jgi:hypothetical protein
MWGVNFFSAFGIGQKRIKAILSKEGEIKIEDLLAEEEAISECKQQNLQLLDFICKKDNLIKLIRYAT